MPAKAKSDLLNRLNQAVEDAQGKRPCKLCVTLDALDPATAAGVRKAIAARRPDGRHAIGPRPLHKMLNEEGIKVSNYSVERHLKEDHQ